jgi:hypothetical protein
MSLAATRAQFGQFNSIGQHGSFPDPFQDVASMAMPDNWRNTLRWCEYIYSSFGTYRTAMERIFSYFLTEVEIGGDVSDEEKEKYEDFMEGTIDAVKVLQSLLRDRMCYGNAFASVMVPFKRYLVSPKTGDMYPLKEVYNNQVFQFEWSDFKFIATCPKTQWRGPWKVVDKPDDEERRLKIKRWSPHEIELLHCPYSDDADIIWRIPEDYKRMIKDGNLYHLERASVQVLQAIKNNQVFRFNPDVVFHMKEPTLSGICNRGWGIPRILSNFRQIWYVQVLRRFNEAIALDYVIPFRLITPAPRGSGGTVGALSTQDPFSMFNAGDMRGQIQSMIRRRRRDPASWQVLPFPVQYQMLGGDANQLAPTDLMNQAQETLLNDAGTPVELYKGTLQLQTAPVALRLFESTWHHLVHDSNMFLTWLIRQVSQIMTWETVDARLKPVTIADNMEKQMAVLQLFMGQQISGTTAFKALGYNWDSEQKLLAEESRRQQELQARQQEEMEQAGFAQEIAAGTPPGGQQPGAAPGGAPAAPGSPAGGAPAGGPPGGDAAMAMAGGTPVSTYIQSMGPNVPVTPNDLISVAEQLAQELLGKPEGIKDSELRKLKQYNEVLHSLVRAKMDQQRQSFKTQGGAMLQQQQQQQQQPPQPGGGAPMPA